jgi:hypothetical protein
MKMNAAFAVLNAWGIGASRCRVKCVLVGRVWRLGDWAIGRLGGWRLAVGGWWLVVGGWRLAIGELANWRIGELANWRMGAERG